MHDPRTVAFDIHWPFSRAKESWQRPHLLTIWHVDPERGGTDDSCGWFMRSRHGDKAKLERIVKRISFDWDRTFTSDGSGTVYNVGWFKPDGQPNLSVIAITVGLFHAAAGIAFSKGDESNWNAAEKFTQRHLAEIIRFAENPSDSLHDSMTRKFAIGCNEPYTKRSRDERIEQLASSAYAWILRKSRPWWRHPRWHVHHWKIQFHPWQKLRRRLLTRCEVCHKPFISESPVRDSWDADPMRWFRGETGLRHDSCAAAGLPATVDIVASSIA